MGNLVFQATLGGQVNLVGPNTASTYNINVPSVNGNLVTTGDTGTVTNTMLAGSIANAKLTNSSVTVGSTSIALGATSTTLDGVNIGATTAGTGAFTTLSGSTSVTTPIVKSASSLTLQSNGTTTAVTIDTSQNVGIGNTTPSSYNNNAYKLVIGSNSAVTGMTLASGTSAAGNIFFARGTSGADAYDGYVQYSQVSQYMAFGTNGGSERMRIDSSGNVLVGKTSLSDSTAGIQLRAGGAYILGSTSDGTEALMLNRNTSDGSIAIFKRANTTVGSISVTASATAYNTSSDYRLKENIAPMTGALAKVAQLKPVTYKWKVDGSDGEGFIAHELQAVVPDCVTGAKDAVDEDGKPVYQGIDVSFLVATLTAAIQELSAKNDALTARVVALEAK
jgi:hypothetical protein